MGTKGIFHRPKDVSEEEWARRYAAAFPPKPAADQPEPGSPECSSLQKTSDTPAQP